MDELLALMKYMVGHNAAHARELADLAVQLHKAGNPMAYEQVMAAVSDFEKGNLRLSAVLSSLDVKEGGIRMCLSTVYRNQLVPEAIIMKNVMTIECKDGCVILTDLMERQVAIEGVLERANLVDGIAVIREANV